MARSRKKQPSDFITQTVSRSLPAPLAWAVASPRRMVVAGLVLSALVSYGIVTINWENGTPKIEFDKNKAAEVGKKAISNAQQLKKKVASGLEQRLASTPEKSESSTLEDRIEKAANKFWGSARQRLDDAVTQTGLDEVEGDESDSRPLDDNDEDSVTPVDEPIAEAEDESVEESDAEVAEDATKESDDDLVPVRTGRKQAWKSPYARGRY